MLLLTFSQEQNTQRGLNKVPIGDSEKVKLFYHFSICSTLIFGVSASALLYGLFTRAPKVLEGILGPAGRTAFLVDL